MGEVVRQKDARQLDADQLFKNIASPLTKGSIVPLTEKAEIFPQGPCRHEVQNGSETFICIAFLYFGKRNGEYFLPCKLNRFCPAYRTNRNIKVLKQNPVIDFQG